MHTPSQQNIENNPMQSSGMIDMSFPLTHLTRRANRPHDGSLTQLQDASVPARVIVTTDALNCRRAIAPTGFQDVPMDYERHHESLFACSRLREEVGFYAKRKIRVRGTHRAFDARGGSPSPQPSPRKRGARGRS